MRSIFTSMALWFVALSALLLAIVAFGHARRTARKLEQVTEMYWQLKFDHGELKARLAPGVPPAPEPKQTFVSLQSLRPDPAKSSPDSR